MWKNIIERGRPQMTIWHMCIACWIPEATNTHIHNMAHVHCMLNTWGYKYTHSQYGTCALHAEYLRLQIHTLTIWHMCIACWIPEATNTHTHNMAHVHCMLNTWGYKYTHSQYVIIICFPTATMVARTHPNVTLYVHCLSCCPKKRDGDCN